MKEKSSNKYVRRSQKDYSMSLKMQVVNEVESGEINVFAAQHKYGIQGNATVLNWLRKYGTFDWEYKIPTTTMPKTQEQKLLELEQKVKLLEKQKATLEKQVEIADKKAIIFDMMISWPRRNIISRSEKNAHPNNRLLQRRNKRDASLCL